jgi:hypothetical protein
LWCFVRDGSSDLDFRSFVSHFSVFIACRGVEVTWATLTTVHVSVVTTGNALLGDGWPGCL